MQKPAHVAPLAQAWPEFPGVVPFPVNFINSSGRDSVYIIYNGHYVLTGVIYQSFRILQLAALMSTSREHNSA